MYHIMPSLLQGVCLVYAAISINGQIFFSEDGVSSVCQPGYAGHICNSSFLVFQPDSVS